MESENILDYVSRLHIAGTIFSCGDKCGCGVYLPAERYAITHTRPIHPEPCLCERASSRHRTYQGAILSIRNVSRQKTKRERCTSSDLNETFDYSTVKASGELTEVGCELVEGEMSSEVLRSERSGVLGQWHHPFEIFIQLRKHNLKVCCGRPVLLSIRTETRYQ